MLQRLMRNLSSIHKLAFLSLFLVGYWFFFQFLFIYFIFTEINLLAWFLFFIYLLLLHKWLWIEYFLFGNRLFCIFFFFLAIKNEDREPGKAKFGFPVSQAANYSVADCRLLVKTLVCGVKNITWRCASFKVPVRIIF